MSVLSPVELAHVTPLLHSKTRMVFEHPLDPNLLIKVHKSRKNLAEARGVRVWMANVEDHFQYSTGILRDLTQFVESRYRDYGRVTEYIAPIYGVIDTDLGLGLLVAAARDSAGLIAPTVRTLLDDGRMTAGRAKALKLMLDAIVETELVIGDLNLENIVLDKADSPDERFLIIDGLGERTFFPVQHWFKFLSARQKRIFAEKVNRWSAEAVKARL